MLGLKNCYFLIPIIGGAPWTGMLIAMLICWAGQGHPLYAFIGYDIYPVYISHIGATNLQPLFISCSAWQGLFYIITILTDYRLRRVGKLQYWFKKDERDWMFAGVCFGAIGQLGIILCSCLNIKRFRRAHSVFLGVFIVALFFSLVCVMVQYAKMGRNYKQIHVNHTIWNKFTLSFLLKLVWTCVSVALAVGFVAADNDTSARFEWTLAFWYTVLWLIFAWDLFPAAKKEHKHQPYIQGWSNRGFYLYDEHLGESPPPPNEKTTATTLHSPNVSTERDETLVPDGEQDHVATNRVFTDDELAQYPLSQGDGRYPIPHGQQVAVYPHVD